MKTRNLRKLLNNSCTYASDFDKHKNAKLNKSGSYLTQISAGCRFLFSSTV